MIEQLTDPPACLVFPGGPTNETCLGDSLLNPLSSDIRFRVNPWYPFQDFYFDELIVSRLLIEMGPTLFRQTMPCRGVTPKYYRVSEASEFDLRVILEWLQYDEGIIWSENGLLIINSFSDFAVLGMSEGAGRRVFGDTIKKLYESSRSIFNGELMTPQAEEYLSLIKTTWPL
jgi:hypothetical protein